MVAEGSLLSNRPELQEAAKVFSHVLKQMDVYHSLEYGGRIENIHTQATQRCAGLHLLTLEDWRRCLFSGGGCRRPNEAHPFILPKTVDFPLTLP